VLKTITLPSPLSLLSDRPVLAGTASFDTGAAKPGQPWPTAPFQLFLWPREPFPCRLAPGHVGA